MLSVSYLCTNLLCFLVPVEFLATIYVIIKFSNVHFHPECYLIRVDLLPNTRPDFPTSCYYPCD